MYRATWLILRCFRAKPTCACCLPQFPFLGATPGALISRCSRQSGCRAWLLTASSEGGNTHIALVRFIGGGDWCNVNGCPLVASEACVF
jgi:hypothetical protein